MSELKANESHMILIDKTRLKLVHQYPILKCTNLFGAVGLAKCFTYTSCCLGINGASYSCYRSLKECWLLSKLIHLSRCTFREWKPSLSLFPISVSPSAPWRSARGGIGPDSGKLQCVVWKEDEALWLGPHLQADKSNLSSSSGDALLLASHFINKTTYSSCLVH